MFLNKPDLITKMFEIVKSVSELTAENKCLKDENKFLRDLLKPKIHTNEPEPETDIQNKGYDCMGR